MAVGLAGIGVAVDAGVAVARSARSVRGSTVDVAASVGSSVGMISTGRVLHALSSHTNRQIKDRFSMIVCFKAARSRDTSRMRVDHWAL
jgi:hypothetical protein